MWRIFRDSYSPTLRSSCSNDQNILVPSIYKSNSTPPPSFIPISDFSTLKSELFCEPERETNIYLYSVQFLRRNSVEKMLGIFSSSVVSPPDELVTAGTRTPSPKITAAALVNRFLQSNASAVSVQIGDHAQLAYTHHNESPWQPRYLHSYIYTQFVITIFSCLRNLKPNHRETVKTNHDDEASFSELNSII